MKSTVLNLKDFKTKQWSGGKTTELFIYPSNSDFEKKNFDFRISTATVEVEESNFTPLPNILRHLMVLNGEINIAHKNHHKSHLAKYQIDSFEGDWETTSVGTCIDFNLMTKGNTQGKLSSLHITSQKKVEILLNSTNEFMMFYSFETAIEFKINSEKRKLNQGELLLIENPLNEKIQFSSEKSCALAVVEIRG